MFQRLFQRSFAVLQHTNHGVRTMSTEAEPIRRVLVVGAGLMGSGIAQVSIHNGFETYIVDRDSALVNKGVDRMEKSLARVLKKELAGADQSAVDAKLADTMKLLKRGTDPVHAVKDMSGRGCDLVIEAIPEKLDLKQQLFTALDKSAPEHTIFASNTSSLRIADIFSILGDKRKPKQIGYHAFNPPAVMKLVEVIRTPLTSEETYQRVFEYARRVRVPITCKDTDGFVVNRLLVPYMMEAVRMLERGDATAADIDTAMVLGAGYPMGPLTLADYVGLDTTKFVIDGWHKRYPENPLFNPSPLLDKLVKDGHLGLKTGRGFYEYNADGTKKKN